MVAAVRYIPAMVEPMRDGGFGAWQDMYCGSDVLVSIVERDVY